MNNKNKLFVPAKMEYVKGKKPKVDCILCSVIKKEPDVEKLEVFTNEMFIVSANLYPYNPGHLMIFPKRHIESITELKKKEVVSLHELQVKAVRILSEIYQPQGYNVGYNLGEASGQSIRHLHLHIVPRYRSELGFIDLIGNTRIIVENPHDTVTKLREEFAHKP